ATEDEALLWLLEQLYRGQQPRNHPALKHYFPSGTWQLRLARLEAEGLIVRESNGTSLLTSTGSDRVQRRLHDDVDGAQRLPFRVHVAPVPRGSAVISDSSQCGESKTIGVRKIAAI